MLINHKLKPHRQLGKYQLVKSLFQIVNYSVIRIDKPGPNKNSWLGMCYILAVQSIYHYYIFKYRKVYICFHNELATILNETMDLSDCITEQSVRHLFYKQFFFLMSSITRSGLTYEKKIFNILKLISNSTLYQPLLT